MQSKRFFIRRRKKDGSTFELRDATVDDARLLRSIHAHICMDLIGHDSRCIAEQPHGNNACQPSFQSGPPIFSCRRFFRTVRLLSALHLENHLSGATMRLSLASSAPSHDHECMIDVMNMFPAYSALAATDHHPHTCTLGFHK